MNGDEYLEELHKIRERMQREMDERRLTLDEYFDEKRTKLPSGIRVITLDEYRGKFMPSESRAT